MQGPFFPSTSLTIPRLFQVVYDYFNVLKSSLAAGSRHTRHPLCLAWADSLAMLRREYVYRGTPHLLATAERYDSGIGL